MTQIVPLAVQHCRRASELHLEYLRTPLQGRSGRWLLQVYYSAVAAGSGGGGYVAEDNDEVIGYVCGIWNARAVRNTLLTRHWTGLLIGVLMVALTRPSLLTNLALRIRRQSIAQDSPTGYELRPIVVAPQLRGTGVAHALVETLLADAGRRGFTTIHLYTETDNAAANAFYARAGFRRTGQIKRAGTTYFRYERSLPSTL